LRHEEDSTIRAIVGSAEAFIQSMSPINAAKTLFAAILLGGKTLENLVKFGKDLSSDVYRAISKKLNELLLLVEGWDEPLCKFVSQNFYRFRP